MKNNISCSFSTLLFIIFLALKLVGAVDWSWWWVTAPLWIPICIGSFIFAITALKITISNWRRK